MSGGSGSVWVVNWFLPQDIGRGNNYNRSCDEEHEVVRRRKNELVEANDVTQILNDARNGDARAAEDLLPLLYHELRQIAARKMSSEAAGHTLQPTALVHEAWLRLVGNNQQAWPSRAYFFAAAAEAMRRILVEHARRKQSQKRGGPFEHEELTESTLVLSAPPDELLAVNDALEKLAAEDQQAAELVKLRYFVGMTMEESASALDLAPRSAERLWTYARAWLQREIKRQS